MPNTPVRASLHPRAPHLLPRALPLARQRHPSPSHERARGPRPPRVKYYYLVTRPVSKRSTSYPVKRRTRLAIRTGKVIHPPQRIWTQGPRGARACWLVFRTAEKTVEGAEQFSMSVNAGLHQPSCRGSTARGKRPLLTSKFVARPLQSWVATSGAEIVCRWLIAIARPNQTDEPDGPLGRFNSSGNETERRAYEPDHEVCAKDRTFADGGYH
jgi:hypothetical protein